MLNVYRNSDCSNSFSQMQCQLEQCKPFCQLSLPRHATAKPLHLTLPGRSCQMYQTVELEWGSKLWIEVTMGQKTQFPILHSPRPHKIMEVLVKKSLHILYFFYFLQIGRREKMCNTHNHIPLLALSFKVISHLRIVQYSWTTFHALPMENLIWSRLQQHICPQIKVDFHTFSDWRENEIAVSNNIWKHPSSKINNK